MLARLQRERTHRTAFTSLSGGVFRVLGEPNVAQREDHRLRAPLAGLWRVEIGAQFRSIYVIHEAREELLVLTVGERAPGQVNDVYRVLLARLRAGDFDEVLATCGAPWVEAGGGE